MDTAASTSSSSEQSLYDQGLTWFVRHARYWSCQALQAGPLPQHIAFVMDGNRRYADRQHWERIAGHRLGYYKLLDALEWCLELGIGCVSVYAFSLDNYKRPAEEVALLMQLAEAKLTELLHEESVVRHRVRVRVLGDLFLLPQPVQTAAQRVMDATEHHAGGTLNICLSYGSQQELAQAVGRVQRAVSLGRLKPEDVTAEDVEQHLYTKGCPPVDLMLRTSGESRLSDFLLWQATNAQLVFSSVLWPEFTFWDLLRALVQFQMASPQLVRLRMASARDDLCHA